MLKHWRLPLAGVTLLSLLPISMAYSEEIPTHGELAPTELEEQPVSLKLAETAAPQASTQARVSIPTISTSRPSFTDAAITVPQGSLQFENGATFTDNRGGAYSWTLPETLVRLGVTNHTELRFTPPNYTYLGDNRPGSLVNHFGDMSVGLSHHIALPGRVDLAVIPILNLPTGANDSSSNALDPQLRVSVLKAVTKKWSIGGHLDTRWNTRQDAVAAVVMNPTLIHYYAFTPKLCGFLEYSGFVPTTGKTSQYLQSGATYAITPRQQVDARLAVGLNKTSPNILVGFGYSFRIDGFFGASRDYASFKR